MPEMERWGRERAIESGGHIELEEWIEGIGRAFGIGDGSKSWRNG
jgi:hypothetical protein